MRYLVIVFMLLLSGCSSIYHEQEGWVPEGYSSQKQSENTYIISFQAYQNEGWNELEHYLLLRAAELGRENNFAYLLLTDVNREEKVELQTVPEVISTTSANHNDVGNMSPVVVTPQYTREFQIRTITSTVIYSNNRESGQYGVEQILSSTSLTPN